MLEGINEPLNVYIVSNEMTSFGCLLKALYVDVSFGLIIPRLNEVYL